MTVGFKNVKDQLRNYSRINNPTGKSFNAIKTNATFI